MLSTKKSVARVILEEGSFENWRSEQREDPSVFVILQGKRNGRRPLRLELPIGDNSARIYWSYWDALVLKDDLLLKGGKLQI